jgi:hypothetical protein
MLRPVLQTTGARSEHCGPARHHAQVPDRLVRMSPDLGQAVRGNFWPTRDRSVEGPAVAGAACQHPARCSP